MKRIKFFTVFIFTFLFLLTAMTQAQITLKIGDNAPEIKYAKWFKGPQVEKLEKGKIYVMEFWATWCGPCKISIPHLTELAHKYKDKVTIIGMDASERPRNGETAESLVENFVKEMGDKMDYCVALDTPDKFMSTNWMNAAGQGYIPTAFIVNKDGILAWIGSPTEMEKPLEQIIDGSFDVKAFADVFGPKQEKAGKEMGERKRISALTKPVMEAYTAKNYAKVVSECEALYAKDSLQTQLDIYYFSAMIQTDPERAFSIAKEEKGKNSKRLAAIAQSFAQKGLDKKFCNLAIEILAPKVEKNPKDYSSLNSLAMAYESAGDNQNAISTLNKMLDFLKDASGAETVVKAINEKIEKLKAAK